MYLIRLGRCERERGNLEAAETYLRRVQELDPGNHATGMSLIEVLEESGKREEALAMAESLSFVSTVSGLQRTSTGPRKQLNREHGKSTDDEGEGEAVDLPDLSFCSNMKLLYRKYFVFKNASQSQSVRDGT